MLYIAAALVVSGGICVLCAWLGEVLPDRWMKKLWKPLKK